MYVVFMMNMVEFLGFEGMYVLHKILHDLLHNMVVYMLHTSPSKKLSISTLVWWAADRALLAFSTSLLSFCVALLSVRMSLPNKNTSQYNKSYNIVIYRCIMTLLHLTSTFTQRDAAAWFWGWNPATQYLEILLE